MRWSPYVALFAIAALAGGTTYWLYVHGRLEEAAGILGMAALTVWFIAGDVQVDKVHERDAKRAERERRDWDSY